MSDADEIRADSMAPLTTRRSRVPLPALLWLGLALSYLLTSASGHRAVAIGIVGLMLGVVIGAAGRWFAGAAVALSMAGAAAYRADSFPLLAPAPPPAAVPFLAGFFFPPPPARGGPPVAIAPPAIRCCSRPRGR